MNPEAPRCIVGGGHHSPALSLPRIRTDNDRPGTQIGIPLLLDRSVKRVHIDMSDDPHIKILLGLITPRSSGASGRRSKTPRLHCRFSIKIRSLAEFWYNLTARTS